MELWIDRRYVRAGYSWSFPADGELRIGVGSFEPRDHVKDADRRAGRRPRAAEAVRFQGNWIPHKLRAATEDGVFFVGDSAGHCLPLTAEGIRPAFYFALALGRELRHVARRARDARAGARALRRLQRAALLAVRVHARRPAPRRAHDRPAPPLRAAVRVVGVPAVGRWAFRHYLAIMPPQFAAWRLPAPAAVGAASLAGVATGTT